MHAQATPSLPEFVASSASGILDACSLCGACVEVCPVAPHAALTDIPPDVVVGGVLEVLRCGGALEGAAAAWAAQCDGCGRCIPACPEGVNPRSMIMLAQTVSAETHTATPQLFRKMARAIRLMAAMQLAPADLARLLQPPRARAVPMVFYVGCNAVRTPHLLFNAMYVLDALEVDYEVLGGPSSCCGIIHQKWEGEVATGERVVDNTLTRFGEFQPERVLSWCPSCQLHIGETLEGFRETSFGFDHVTTFLIEQTDALKGRFKAEVPMRVLLHAHDGMADLGGNVEQLLRAIPGLQLVDTVWESGYTCGGSGADRSPGLKAERRAETLRRVAEPGIDALVTLYHGCHAQLSAACETGGFKVVNWTDLLVRALGGTPRADVLEGWRTAQQWQSLVTASQANLRANRMELDPQWLAAILPDVLAYAEFRGGLEVFAAQR